jgi:phosphatidylglycerol:prolipoprotein diacylglycerol transferase
MHPILFHIGTWPVYTYGVMCATGLTVGYFIMAHWASQEGVEEDDYLNLFIILLLTSIGGARLIFALTYPEFFTKDWTDVFRLWKGGLTIMGGGFITLIAFFAYCRWYKLKTGLILDIFFGAFPVGIFFGRIGCFAFGCCYGRPTDLPWAISFPTARPIVPRHPTQIYSSLIMIVIFLIILWYRRRPHVDGMVTVVFMYLYCLYRIPMEWLRADVALENNWGLTNSQAWCVVLFVLTFLSHLYLRKLPPDRPKEAVESS